MGRLCKSGSLRKVARELDLAGVQDVRWEKRGPVRSEYYLFVCGIGKEGLYFPSPNIILVIKSRIMRWAGNAGRVVDRRSAYRVLMGKREGRRPLGRSRWENNIKMDLREWDKDMDWIDLTEDRDRCRALVNAVMNIRF